jgi:hypothetical protein
MAGYDNYSKSNNAVAAERDGKMTASKLAKQLRCSTSAIKALLKPCEWHHASSWFNCTDYYDESDLLLAATDIVDADQYENDCEKEDCEKENCEDCEQVMRQAQEMLARLRAFHSVNEARTFIARRVKWLEWSGSRAHPHATEETRKNIQITIKGQFAILHGCGIAGKDLRKKIDARGFSIEEPPVVLTGTAAQV